MRTTPVSSYKASEDTKGKMPLSSYDDQRIISKNVFQMTQEMLREKRDAGSTSVWQMPCAAGVLSPPPFTTHFVNTVKALQQLVI